MVALCVGWLHHEPRCTVYEPPKAGLSLQPHDRESVLAWLFHSYISGGAPVLVQVDLRWPAHQLTGSDMVANVYRALPSRWLHL